MDKHKFLEKLKEINVTLERKPSGYYVSVDALEAAWKLGRLEFVDRPPVSIHEVLNVAVDCHESEWLALRERVLKLGIITRG